MNQEEEHKDQDDKGQDIAELLEPAIGNTRGTREFLDVAGKDIVDNRSQERDAHALDGAVEHGLDGLLCQKF